MTAVTLQSKATCLNEVKTKRSDCYMRHKQNELFGVTQCIDFSRIFFLVVRELTVKVVK